MLVLNCGSPPSPSMISTLPPSHKYWRIASNSAPLNFSRGPPNTTMRAWLSLEATISSLYLQQLNMQKMESLTQYTSYIPVVHYFRSTCNHASTLFFGWLKEKHEVCKLKKCRQLYYSRTDNSTMMSVTTPWVAHNVALQVHEWSLWRLLAALPLANKQNHQYLLCTGYHSKKNPYSR